MKKWLAAGAGLILGAELLIHDRQEAGGAEPAPIIVELFTSEGCSSCPPADEVLAELDRSQPIGGARVIALELHVDYWNQLGWTDPFSHADFSARQGGYAGVTKSLSIYTPQMIVDGRAHFVGSSKEKAHAAITAATKTPKAAVRLARAGDVLKVQITDVPAPASGDLAEVWLAVTESDLLTAIPRGENAGRTVAHAPVVRSLKRLGPVSQGAFTGDAPVSISKSSRRDNVRAVIFVQEQKSRRMTGAATLSMKGNG